MFKAATDCLGVMRTDNSICIEWEGPGRVVFSYSKIGMAINAHFASDSDGLRHVKHAINDFCEWAFYSYTWCKMIIAIIEKPSVVRIVKKCDFKHVVSVSEKHIYARKK